MRTKLAMLILAMGAIASCTSSETIQTSKNTAIVSTSAAPICGGNGAARSAYKQAAISTIKAGYNSFIIVNGQAQNNVRAFRGPGTYNTMGNVNGFGGFNATTTYQPGPVMYAGSHDQQFAVQMFKDGQPGSANAISAREALGKDWAKIVKSGVHVCS